MAALRKALSPYDSLFAERGFHLRAGQESGQRYATGEGLAVRFDRIKTGDLRCFLEIGAPPIIKAESPWWKTRHGDSLDSAVATSWKFLAATGFSFLAHPEDLTLTAWRERHNLLVRDFRKCAIYVIWPPDWSLNQRVIAVKRSIPQYKKLATLELRQELQSRSRIRIGGLSLLEAKELLPTITSEGLIAEIGGP